MRPLEDCSFDYNTVTAYAVRSAAISILYYYSFSATRGWCLAVRINREPVRINILPFELIFWPFGLNWEALVRVWLFRSWTVILSLLTEFYSLTLFRCSNVTHLTMIVKLPAMETHQSRRLFFCLVKVWLIMSWKVRPSQVKSQAFTCKGVNFIP